MLISAGPATAKIEFSVDTHAVEHPVHNIANINATTSILFIRRLLISELLGFSKLRLDQSWMLARSLDSDLQHTSKSIICLGRYHTETATNAPQLRLEVRQQLRLPRGSPKTQQSQA
jgi:hypothetical protein